ncbi:MAG: hypothetical protein EOO30_18300 [Comamonadaceae bacterium]|nr:MAG: hypothetical protein EOO30_18300 [Comamonadaceae bacterium]
MKTKDAQPPRRSDERFKTVAQVLAILLLAGMTGMLLHKGHADFTALAQQNPGESFWPALVRHVFRNLAGG